ncbi:MAG: 3-deoxy-7-phosphoheptulonate synthase [Bdellovibrionales bacterium GWA2_49_15]|nr:MAG: 3-deoxy-7-phosphoheptulonate synthase [Bdellovibrionales bacterium GWA2_49_15]
MMSKRQLSDLNVVSTSLLVTPSALKNKLPLPDSVGDVVARGRETIRNIMDRKDHRLIAVIGPCSIHDVKAAKEYGQKLAELARQVEDTLFIVMRTYFEKPRTTTGWKGLINDPYLNDTFKINEGLEMARQVLLDLSSLGLPLGTEALDPITPQYLQDLISWSAIGARTTESQTHRELASGLSGPVGFKNGTDGGVQVAINALKSAAGAHRFLGINGDGQVAIIHTKGNAYSHLVLRGGNGRPNYDSVSITLCEQELKKAKLPVNIMVDCSHANSNKDAALQPLVLKNINNQIRDGNRSIIGFMLESNLQSGQQEIPLDHAKLQYGQSVTDACINWKSTEECVLEAREMLKSILPSR